MLALGAQCFPWPTRGGFAHQAHVAYEDPSVASLALEVALLGALLLVPSARALPAATGWRGNARGSGPMAKTPLEWYRIPRGAPRLLTGQATRPEGKNRRRRPWSIRDAARLALSLGRSPSGFRARFSNEECLKAKPTLNRPPWTCRRASVEAGQRSLPTTSWCSLPRDFPVCISRGRRVSE